MPAQLSRRVDRGRGPGTCEVEQDRRRVGATPSAGSPARLIGPGAGGRGSAGSPDEAAPLAPGWATALGVVGRVVLALVVAAGVALALTLAAGPVATGPAAIRACGGAFLWALALASAGSRR